MSRAANRRPTMEDVAASAGVSRALVSLVMRDSPKVSAERRGRVLAAADALGYRPNKMAASLAGDRTGTVGVLLNDLHNPFFADIAGGIEDLASELGYQLLLGTGRRRLQRERTVIDALQDYRVDGLIAVSPRVPTADLVEAARRTPTVVIGRSVRSPSIDTVMIDEQVGVQAVVNHLVGLGHRDIAHVTGGVGAGAAHRSECFVRAIEALGLGPARTLAGDFTEESGIAAAERLLASGRIPTAVFAANDLTAAGLIETFARVGLHSPTDVSVVGYDNIYVAGMRQISLTTVDQPRVAMGRLSLELLIERVEGRTERVTRLVQPRLIVRGTTARAPAAARDR